MLRNYLLILLVVLLPIRSFAAEIMGFSMAQSTYSKEMIADGNFSHCDMMQTSSTNPNTQSEQHDNPTCNDCSLCMAFAFTVPTQFMNINQLSYQFLQREVLLIDSAFLAGPQKPPIL
jgi:hypothetical protein